MTSSHTSTAAATGATPGPSGFDNLRQVGGFETFGGALIQADFMERRERCDTDITSGCNSEAHPENITSVLITRSLRRRTATSVDFAAFWLMPRHRLALGEFARHVPSLYPDDDCLHSPGPQQRFDVGLVAGEDMFLRLHKQRNVGVR